MPAGSDNFTSTLRRHANSDCRAHPDDPYSAFVDGLKARKRGRGLTSDIDRAPGHLSDLAAYFAAIEPERLRSCWVACILDAIAPEQIGDMARALVVVAERLHGVAFEPTVVPSPRRTTMPPTTPAATNHVPGHQQPGLTPPRATPVVPDQTLPGGYRLGAGEPPPPAEKPKGKNADLLMACAALQPGQWFIIDKPGKMTKPLILRHSEKRKWPVTAYHLADGRLVVKSTK